MNPASKILKLLTVPFSLLILSSCAQQIPEAVNGWIEYPVTENIYQESFVTAYQTNEIEIPVAASQALEYAINIEEGDTIVYQWNVEMDDPSLLDIEFHGHTSRVGDEPGLLMFYKIHNNSEESGAMTAPFSGMHGWYLNNTSDQDIVLKLSVSGFYTLAEGA